MFSMYAKAKLSICILTVRERAAAYMQGTVFTLARLKIVPTIKNLYHIEASVLLNCVDGCFFFQPTISSF